MKIGIAGAGFMGLTHAECYKKLNNVELYAIADKNQNRRNDIQKKYSIKKAYKDVFEMIDDNEIDIIDICLPTYLHRQAAIYALEKNKNVLMEKPIALNIEDAMFIKKSAEKSKGKFMIAQVLRFWPEYLLMRKIIRERLNSDIIREIFCSRINEIPLWSESSWILNEEQSGGLITDLMIHDIDYVIWNFGKVKQVFGSAILNQNGFAVQVVAILKHEAGTTAYIEGGYLNPGGKGLTTQTRIYGNKSLLEMDSMNNSLLLTYENNIREKIPVTGNDGYFEEINYFIHCVKNDKIPEIITVDEAIYSLNICMAIKKSIDNRSWIVID